MSSTKVILYIAQSFDGFIALPGDDLTFLSLVEKEGEDYGYGAFTASVDTVIMGRKTYDWVMTQVPEFPHKDKLSYIITRTTRPSEGNVHFYTGSLSSLVKDLKAKQGGHIFVDGGAEIVNMMLKEQLIDEMIISVIPVMLGKGVRLFDAERPYQNLQLVSAKTFDSGLLQMHYKVLENNF